MKDAWRQSGEHLGYMTRLQHRFGEADHFHCYLKATVAIRGSSHLSCRLGAHSYDRAAIAAGHNALRRAVGFALAASNHPAVIATLAGQVQTCLAGTQDLRGIEVAWPEACLALFPALPLADFVKDFGTLAISRIGGRPSLFRAR